MRLDLRAPAFLAMLIGVFYIDYDPDRANYCLLLSMAVNVAFIANRIARAGK